jgi:hypothetical protein
MRAWFEVSIKHLSLDCKSTEDAKRSGIRWFPYCKGGDFRKWYGNLTFVVDWKDDGQVLKALKTASGKLKSRPQNTELYFRSGITFSALTSAVFSCRIMKNAIFGGGGSALFSKDPLYTIGFLNSKLNSFFMDMLNPTMNMLVGDLDRLPFLYEEDIVRSVREGVEEILGISKADWDSCEASWDFQVLPLLTPAIRAATIKESYQTLERCFNGRFQRMKTLEEENNRLFIHAYGLEKELSPDVPEDQITLRRASREEDMKYLISYAIGCMMGRYSLDKPGLIYAHSTNKDFDPSQ